MVNLELLGQTVDDSGIKLLHVAEKIGITRESLYNKMSGKTEFTASEIKSLSDVLGLTRTKRDDIFFAEKCE